MTLKHYINPVKLAKILVVDDTPINMDLLTHAVEDMGHDAIEATDGQDAWVKTASGQIDFAILDYDMPIMNGIDFVKKIQAGGFEGPVIFLSGHGDPATLKKIEGLKIHKFIEKPFEPEEIVKTIKNIFQLS